MLERYWHLCPDFVIEVRSPTDRWRTVREKMREWIENGAQLAWLIDPESRGVEIYRANGGVEILTNPESLSSNSAHNGRAPRGFCGRVGDSLQPRSAACALKGEGPVEGFTLDLPPVWDPLSH